MSQEDLIIHVDSCLRCISRINPRKTSSISKALNLMVFTAVHQTIFKTTYDYDSAPKQFGILLNDIHVHTI